MPGKVAAVAPGAPAGSDDAIGLGQRLQDFFKEQVTEVVLSTVFIVLVLILVSQFFGTLKLNAKQFSRLVKAKLTP